MKVAKLYDSGVNLSVYYDLIDQALYTGGFISYREVYDYANGLDDIMNSFDELLHENQPETVITLVEYMLPKVEKAINEVDDSDGSMGEILHRLEEIYYQACVKAKPSPVELARKLFRFELQSDFDTFYHAAEKYSALLGEQGLNIYRVLAEEYDSPRNSDQ